MTERRSKLSIAIASWAMLVMACAAEADERDLVKLEDESLQDVASVVAYTESGSRAMAVLLTRADAQGIMAIHCVEIEGRGEEARIVPASTTMFRAPLAAIRGAPGGAIAWIDSARNELVTLTPRVPDFSLVQVPLGPMPADIRPDSPDWLLGAFWRRDDDSVWMVGQGKDQVSHLIALERAGTREATCRSVRLSTNSSLIEPIHFERLGNNIVVQTLDGDDHVRFVFDAGSLELRRSNRVLLGETGNIEFRRFMDFNGDGTLDFVYQLVTFNKHVMHQTTSQVVYWIDNGVAAPEGHPQAIVDTQNMNGARLIGAHSGRPSDAARLFMVRLDEDGCNLYCCVTDGGAPTFERVASKVDLYRKIVWVAPDDRSGVFLSASRQGLTRVRFELPARKERNP